jgi:hypothetical protein
MVDSKGLFRKKPSKEFVEEILVYLQFLGLHDRKIFIKNDISQEKFEEVVTWIEPYYIPCKAKKFLFDLNPSKQITILRHLLRSIDYDLIAQEKVINSNKVTTYQIIQKFIQFDSSGIYLIEFS